MPLPLGRAEAAPVRVLALALLLLLGVACTASPPPATPAPVTTPTALPAPAALSSPATSDVSPAPSPAAPVVAPPAAPKPPAAAPPSAGQSGGAGRVRVANTEGQGANLRAEPSASAARVKTVREGTELEVIGPDRAVEGRTWRNVRDPSDGASGWIVADLLVTVPSAEPTGTPVAAPPATAAPAAGSPTPPVLVGTAAATRRIGDPDRAYLATLQPEIDTIGKAITAINDQIEVASGRPAALEDASWRAATEVAGRSLADAAGRLRATTPGPLTGEVHDRARGVADRADEAAQLLNAAVEARDPRRFGQVRTALLRVVSEMNAMNAALIQLQ